MKYVKVLPKQNPNAPSHIVRLLAVAEYKEKYEKTSVLYEKQHADSPKEAS